MNPRKLSLHLAQPIDTGADYKPIINSNPNLNYIYINEDVGLDEGREKDCVESIANARLDIFQMLPNLLQDMWSTREHVVTRYEALPSCCAASRMKRDTTPESLVFVLYTVVNLKTDQL